MYRNVYFCILVIHRQMTVIMFSIPHHYQNNNSNDKTKNNLHYYHGYKQHYYLLPLPLLHPATLGLHYLYFHYLHSSPLLI